MRKRPCDLDHLPVLDPEVGGARLGVDAHVPGVEEFGGLLLQPAPADETLLQRLPVDEEVLCDRQLGYDGGFLVDAGDKALPGSTICHARSCLTPKPDQAAIRIAKMSFAPGECPRVPSDTASLLPA